MISVKDNKDQSKNARDLGIAYILVFVTYTLLGLIFYLAYPGWKGCITDMFIDVSSIMFCKPFKIFKMHSSKLAFRISTNVNGLFQCFIFWCLFVFWQSTHFWHILSAFKTFQESFKNLVFHWSNFKLINGLVYDWLLKLIQVFMNTEWPGYTKVFLVNLAIVAVGCSCAMFYDKVRIWPGINQSFIEILRLVILFATLEVFVQWFICFSCHVESRWVVKNSFFLLKWFLDVITKGRKWW